MREGKDRALKAANKYRRRSNEIKRIKTEGKKGLLPAPPLPLNQRETGTLARGKKHY